MEELKEEILDDEEETLAAAVGEGLILDTKKIPSADAQSQKSELEKLQKQMQEIERRTKIDPFEAQLEENPVYMAEEVIHVPKKPSPSLP